MSEHIKVETTKDNLIKIVLLDPIYTYRRGCVSEQLTPLEAEKFAKEVSDAAHKARQAGIKPKKFGEH